MTEPAATKQVLTEPDLMRLAAADPRAAIALDQWRAIKARGGRPVAWRNAHGSCLVCDASEGGTEELD